MKNKKNGSKLIRFDLEPFFNRKTMVNVVIDISEIPKQRVWRKLETTTKMIVLQQIHISFAINRQQSFFDVLHRSFVEEYWQERILNDKRLL